MSRNEYLYIIGGMLIATYIPRVLPFLLFKKEKVSKELYKFLTYIPYAMLGALIFPGVLTSVEGSIPISTIAFIAGFISCFFIRGTIAPILIAVLTATGLLMGF